MMTQIKSWDIDKLIQVYNRVGNIPIYFRFFDKENFTYVYAPNWYETTNYYVRKSDCTKLHILLFI